ncbi:MULTISPECIES: copper transporter [Brevibacillus]|uniref:Copper transport outer membrane protein, MctB n=1 Tax=Brevibacillus aydinogluensis TaxID=927786 RepID=A0AA48RHN7_9BACL|nr:MULTISPECIES: copper transporter [Bacillales]MDT3415266.1 hypothetical protein [Brevibacillus aydinogluensis]REK62331.1 MAG: hypothetical protein DF221_13610 [Brevibacillus sp.]UFJ60363.1 copper transporter [Anoxybacillus sediminis]CAJ1002955.1 Copper transport outer membrane protein, MctB [Brevibacillus aydinogluensis]
MIHFRHHLLSLAAVFLALGIGILLGGTAGQSWFALKEQEVLKNMEAKYDQALRSNSELKQQLNRILAEMERNHEEMEQLLASRYANELKGSSVYVWHADQQQLLRLKQIFRSVGVNVLAYREGSIPSDGPLLVFGPVQPDWLSTLPNDCRWLYAEEVPDSPSKQWGLLENVQKLLTEMREAREKNS